MPLIFCMLRSMNLNFTFDSSKILASIGIVHEFLLFLRDSGMYHYFPFSDDDLTNSELVQAQVDRDAEHFQLGAATDELARYWESHAVAINNALAPYLAREGLTLEPSYTCALTCYGPYGYYYTPATVYVNITERTTDEHIQTILHELLHLVLYERTKDLGGVELEHVIDCTFVEVFGEIFPDYRVQDMA